MESNGGAIWCMAANPMGNFIAIGCEDGAVRLFSVQRNRLDYVRTFEKTDGMVR